MYAEDPLPPQKKGTYPQMPFSSAFVRYAHNSFMYDYNETITSACAFSGRFSASMDTLRTKVT